MTVTIGMMVKKLKCFKLLCMAVKLLTSTTVTILQQLMVLEQCRYINMDYITYAIKRMSLDEKRATEEIIGRVLLGHSPFENVVCHMTRTC